MSFIRYLFLGLLALCLLILALANRAPVTLRIVPEDMAAYVGLDLSVTLPLFIVLFLAIAVGLLVGFVWEWLREHKHRAEASRERAERERLEKELDRTRGRTTDEDDVLAIVNHA